MSIWYIIIGIVVILICGAIWRIHILLKEDQRKLNAKWKEHLLKDKIYYRCMNCGLPFIPDPSYIKYMNESFRTSRVFSGPHPTCPNCGQWTVLHGEPFSKEDLDQQYSFDRLKKKFNSLDMNDPNNYFDYYLELSSLYLKEENDRNKCNDCLRRMVEISNLDMEHEEKRQAAIKLLELLANKR